MAIPGLHLSPMTDLGSAVWAASPPKSNHMRTLERTPERNLRLFENIIASWLVVIYRSFCLPSEQYSYYLS